MQIEKNMYIRTKKGEISKVFAIQESGRILTNDFWCYKDKVTKASYNIIDLIEVGDYVNGFKITRISGDFEPFVEALYRYIKNDNNIIYIFYEEDIKSIVTKEQFESMEYKVK